MQEPFVSVPLIWLIHEDILGERLPLYVQFGWEGLIGEWRSAFARADVVVFPDFSFPVMNFSIILSLSERVINFYRIYQHLI